MTCVVRKDPGRSGTRTDVSAHARRAISGFIGVLAAALLGSAGHGAEGIDSRLVGAWTASAADCQKLFERTGGGFTYRQPVDKFAQAFIIEPGQIRSPTGSCRVLGVSHDKDGTAVSMACHDSISFLTQTVHFKVRSGSEIVFSPTGDPSLDTTYERCPL